jgi:nucleoside-triphosphatase
VEADVLRILLEGRPGVGKTTVVRRLLPLLQSRGIGVVGFTTEEIRAGRQGGHRTGFSIEAIGGPRAILARAGRTSEVMVGRYGVDLTAIERVALPALARAAGRRSIVVMDELGRMELASAAFVEAVSRVFAADHSVVATAHLFSHPFTDALKARPDVEVIRVTPENRDGLPGQLAVRLAPV